MPLFLIWGILLNSVIIVLTLSFHNSKNSTSNRLVVYNSDTRDFELVRADDLKGISLGNSSSNSPQGSQSDESTYICVNCGTLNHQYHQTQKKRSNSQNYPRRYHSGNKYPFQSSSYPFFDSTEDETKLTPTNTNNSTRTYQPEHEYSQTVIGQKELKSLKKLIERGIEKDYSTTSSGDLLSHDYFKLLASTIPKADDSNRAIKLIKDEFSDSGLSESELEDVETDANGDIPIDLINQGYFDRFFKVINKLGSGSFGTVYKVEHELLGLNLGIFALKKIPIGNDRNNLVKILNEVKFLYNLSYLSDSACTNGNSSHVVKYNHAWLELSKMSQFGPEIPIVFLLFEYCDGGTLEDWVEGIVNPKFDIKQEIMFRRMLKQNGGGLTKPRMLTNFEIFRIFSDIVQGLKYLHDLKIIHRDLKPSNCLFKTKFDLSDSNPISSLNDISKIPTLLVSDFGESIMEDNKRTNVINRSGATGTIEYCAPELLRLDDVTGKLNQFDFSSDIYSLGMILFYLCFGKLPYKTSGPVNIRTEILEAKLFDDLKEMKDKLNDNLIDEWIYLTEELVKPNPNKRPDTDSILLTLSEIRGKLELLSVNPVSLSSDEENESDDELELESSDSESEWEALSDPLNIHHKNRFMRDIRGFDSNILIIGITFVINSLILNELKDSLFRNWTNIQFLIVGIVLGSPRRDIKYWLTILQLISSVFIIIRYFFISA